MENTATLKKSLGAIRRKAVDLSQFSPVRETQLSESELLPLVVEPAADQVDLAEWARNHRDYDRISTRDPGAVVKQHADQ